MRKTRAAKITLKDVAEVDWPATGTFTFLFRTSDIRPVLERLSGFSGILGNLHGCLHSEILGIHYRRHPSCGVA